MYLAFCLLVGNFLCLILDASSFGSTDLNLMNYLLNYSSTQTSNGIPVITASVFFFTHGLPKMLLWDFSFLSGGLQIVRWFLMILSIGAVWAIAQDFRGTVTSIFGRR
jgi:hypothetical protein